MALVLFLGSAAEAVEAIWIGPETGLWNVGANWSTGALPDFNIVARIDDKPEQNTRVESSSATPTVGHLVIDAGDTLAVINSRFSVGRVLSHQGTISVEGVNAQLSAGSLMLNSGGEVRLSGHNTVASIVQLFNQGEIRGGGRLVLGTNESSVLTIYNDNMIRADNPLIPLTLQTHHNTQLDNNGRLAATDGGTLQIQTLSSFQDFGIIGGRIEAHPGSTVAIGSLAARAYVENAVLARIDDDDPLTATPAFTFSQAKLRNITFEGDFQLSGADFAGTIRNTGEISTGAFTSSPNWHNDLVGEVILLGGGTVYLPGSPQAMFGGGSGVYDRLINVDNVIRGRGELLVSWTGFTNRHVVQAETSGELVFYNGLSDALLVNSGVMKAINGGRLRLGYPSGSLGIMENFEGMDVGEIVATEGASVALANIHIKGGVLRAEGDNPATRGKYIADQLVVLEEVTMNGDFRFVTVSGQLSTITLSQRVFNTGSMAGRFSVGAQAELAGGGEIIGEGGTLFSFTSSTASFINGDNLIRGSGNINGVANNRFTNRGTIRSDGSIVFNPQLPVVNSGRIEAGPGAQVSMPTIPVVLNSEPGTSGVIHAADGGIVKITRVEGGILSTEGKGVIRGEGGYIKDLRNLGTFEASGVVPQGTIVNDGLIRGALTASSSFARFDGTGTLETTNSSFTGGFFANGPEHTILGSGSFGSLSMPPTVFVNEGTLRAHEGLPLSIRTFIFTNTGLVHAPAERTMTIISATGRVENGGGTIQVDGNLAFSAPAGVYNLNGALIDVGGVLTLEQTALQNRPGGTIVGSGEIAGAVAAGPLVVNEGIVAPGTALATLRVGDDFQQTATGQLQLEISAGASPTSDLLEIDGAASLAGSLLVSLVGEDALGVGDSFTLLTATEGISGTFGQLLLPALEDGMFWLTQYLPTEFRATVAQTIPGDYNLDGRVDASDYVLWRKSDGEPSGYEDWAANFGETSDIGGGSWLRKVPEPTSVSLLLLCGGVIPGLRRHNHVCRNRAIATGNASAR